MTETTITTTETTIVTGNRAEAEDKGTFIFGGRKRKVGDAFTKIERAVVFANLPEESRAFLIRYGIRQYLSDGAASAKDQTAFETGIDSRIDNLCDADFTRNTGEGPAPTNDPEVLADQLARNEVGKAIRDAKATVTKEQRATAVAGWRAANAERLVKEAKAQIESRQTAAGGIDLAALGIILPA